MARTALQPRDTPFSAQAGLYKHDLDETRVWQTQKNGSDDALIDTRVFRRSPAGPGADNLRHTAAFGGGAPERPALRPHLYGPDGQPVEQDDHPLAQDSTATLLPGPESHQKVEMHDRGWFHAESNRYEQEQLAQVHLNAIVTASVDRQMAGLCNDGRWVNNPNEFPDLGLVGTITSNPVIPFPPNDQQFFVRGKYNTKTSKLRPAAVPDSDGYDSSVWVRLIDFGQHADAVHLFDEFSAKSHCGRIIQGSLDNGYFVEALQAIALRPKLVKQLFYGWNTRRSVYVTRLWKHGTWMRVEVDDYVPVGGAVEGDDSPNVPICCRSEYFPNVTWPSLVEKAYAKMHTIRGSPSAITLEDRGGWEALNGGGKTEEALADLTGGVAGRFHTYDVSAERLFLYIHELQMDTLFVCRVNEVTCEAQGVRLNPYYPHAVNRAVSWEGRLFIQVFCGAPGVFDGGLQDITVPYSLIHCEDYPETMADGFFWMSAMDFREYFETIFECRLVNSVDVSIPNMPPPRWQAVRPSLGPLGIPPPGMFPGMGTMPGPMSTMPGMIPFGDMGTGMAGARGMQHLGPDGSPLPWYEWVFANPGEVTRHNAPEFSVRVPETDVPCEIVCSIEQLDSRMQMKSPQKDESVPLIVKVYENVEGDQYYSKDLVCRSNWIPVRDSMVAFQVTRGGEFKIVAEFPDGKSKVGRMIFRCYASRPNVMVTANTMFRSHLLVVPVEPPRAIKLSLVGTMHPEDMDDPDAPVWINSEHDAMRKPEFDVDPGWSTLAKEVKEDCSVM